MQIADLAGYVTLRLERETMQEGATRNLPASSRFLGDEGAFRHRTLVALQRSRISVARGL